MQRLIKSSLDYIEHNLKTDITADELAAMANYSVRHYCRLFAQAMDTTVASYILKRRLDHALAEISSGRKAINVVLEYGFDTYSGFYKSFVKMYGCSPKKYLNIYLNKKSEVLFMYNINEIKKTLANWEISPELQITDITHSDWQTKEKSEWKTWDIGGIYYLKTNERSKMIRNITIAKSLSKYDLASEFSPILTKRGNDYLDGEHIFLLTKKLGEPLNHHPLSDEEIAQMANNELREKYSFALGQAIAKLHNALKAVQDDIKPWESNLYEQGKNAIPKLIKQDLGLSDDFFNDYVENFGRLYDKLPKQLIHGNLCVETAVYKNDQVTGFKGFETFELSCIRIYDITWAAGEINTQPSMEKYLKMLAEMLKGYDSINPLSKEEIQSAYYVLCATYFRNCAYFTEEMDGVHDLLARSKRAMVFLANNKEMLCNLL
ncbi:MAG: helix-turn-helix domain-containing protein [Defluviitaleaceae bacterium]|nr:helix-turn-helix domain-containing protein [Defluviitaleaceae bacterium]